MRWLIGLLLFLLIALQTRLWFSDGGLLEVWRLEATVAEQQAENSALRRRNEILEAEVRDLKVGLDAIEERARSELGMIKQGEVFYQVVESEGKAE